ncbi:MAG: hypothetical protein VKM98_01665 [Cyanobacteriota bacterium]|nr:hypothetical protein [Cyanobacteriota bacterium]
MAEHSNLPAPYESPWRQLGQALRSVAASLGLDLRFLWRRNRSGTLPRPAVWPQSLAPLFWPLVALVLLLVLTLASVGGVVLLQRAPSPGATPPGPARETTVLAPETLTPEPAPTPATAAVTNPAPPARPPQPSPEAAADPLLEQLTHDDEDPGLISAIQADPARAALQLQLSPAFGQRDSRSQRRLAEAWLERSLQLGFEQLELIDAQGQVVGYRARVGSGMILLNPAATP